MEVADAVVLTATGLNSTGINANGLVRSFVPRTTNLQSARYAGLDKGYLTRWINLRTLIHEYSASTQVPTTQLTRIVDTSSVLSTTLKVPTSWKTQSSLLAPCSSPDLHWAAEAIMVSSQLRSLASASATGDSNNNMIDVRSFTVQLAFTSKQDYIVCDDEREGIFEKPIRTFYKNAQPFVPYLHPN